MKMGDTKYNNKLPYQTYLRAAQQGIYIYMAYIYKSICMHWRGDMNAQWGVNGLFVIKLTQDTYLKTPNPHTNTTVHTNQAHTRICMCIHTHASNATLRSGTSHLWWAPFLPSYDVRYWAAVKLFSTLLIYV